MRRDKSRRLAQVFAAILRVQPNAQKPEKQNAVGGENSSRRKNACEILSRRVRNRRSGCTGRQEALNGQEHLREFRNLRVRFVTVAAHKQTDELETDNEQ